MDLISRICVLAKPRHNHPDFKEWQTANIVVFVKANSREDAIDSARQILEQERWDVLRINLCDRLVEARVQEQGGEVWDCYQKANADGHAIKLFPKHFGAEAEGMPTIRPPRVTEAFMDQVVASVGGSRIETDGKTRLVDYRVDDWLFELKDLQEEGLMQPDRQKKLAELFRPYMTDDVPYRIDPAILSETERHRYFDIISSPIQGQVKSASKQIRATKERLRLDSLRGGIIYLNTGYGSFPEEEFGPLVERYVRKDTTQIEAVLAISIWSVTNGFDSNIFFSAYPTDPQHAIIRRIQDSFGQTFEQAMTKLVTGQLNSSEQLSDPLKPITFAIDGLDFAWLPPELPASWLKESPPT